MGYFGRSGDQAPTDLFETLLEIQDQLEALKSVKDRQGTAGQELISKLKAERSTLEVKRAALEGRLAELFHIWDRLVDHAQKPEKEQGLKQMRDILSQRNYLNTMLANIAEALK